MIKSFKHKGLSELFKNAHSSKVRQDLQSRSLRRLDALEQAESLTDLKVPGFNFHGLQGKPNLDKPEPKRLSDSLAKKTRKSEIRN